MTTEASSIAQGKLSWVRYRVLGMLALLSFILYLDRICISQAVPAIEADLDIEHTMMGFILGAFTVAYGVFEIPTGHWGDRYGSRGVLTRIVLWWSLFTSLTGLATGFWMLLGVRFLFGAGEAGAFPNAARVVARWFPLETRSMAQGIVVTSALIGGTAAPVVTELLLANLGWRWTFITLGIPGVVWAAFFYWWYRDDPAEHPAVNSWERAYISGDNARPTTGHLHPAIPWKRVLASHNVWLLGMVTTSGAFTTYLFFSWYPTYLQKGRGVDPADSSWLASMVLGGGALGCILGGFVIDWLLKRFPNRARTRSFLGFAVLMSAAAAMSGSIAFESATASAACAMFASFCIHLQIASWWGAVTDISGKHIGALFGLMNGLGVPGAVGSQFFLGWLVDYLTGLGYTGRAQWDPAFYIYGAVLAVGACCWLATDTSKSAVHDAPPEAPPCPAS